MARQRWLDALLRRVLALAESDAPRRPGQRRLSLGGQSRALAGAFGALLVLGGGAGAFLGALSGAGESVPSHPAAARTVVLADTGMARSVASLAPAPDASPDLPPATSAPAPAPASVADAPPLSSHEVFAFAPYWTLDQSAGFDVADMTTIAYFSVDVNPDGTLDESGPGWNGFESQDLADLITRAHQAGDRVVLSVTCLDQGALDQLTSDPSAPDTLAAAVLSAVASKQLDGVNLDFEGEGSADQAGLTNLVKVVSTALHSANPNYQVTMDTYASSAGDPDGFYDIPALAPYVDAFFVMAYELNLSAAASAESPLTSSMFSNLETVEQYTAAVPASKVILGLPFYGYDWPTTNGTLSAQAEGAPSTVTYAQVASSGHPLYWDPVTDTAWTSYEVGGQWHESFIEDATSLYQAATMASDYHVAGVGIWALGFDDNDVALLSALDGYAPAQKELLAGPTSTSESVAALTGEGAAAAGKGSAGRSGKDAGAATTATTRPPRATTTTTTHPKKPKKTKSTGSTTTTDPGGSTTTSGPTTTTTGPTSPTTTSTSTTTPSAMSTASTTTTSTTTTTTVPAGAAEGVGSGGGGSDSEGPSS